MGFRRRVGCEAYKCKGELRRSCTGLKGSGWLLGSIQRRRSAVGPGLKLSDSLASPIPKAQESLWTAFSYTGHRHV